MSKRCKYFFSHCCIYAHICNMYFSKVKENAWGVKMTKSEAPFSYARLFHPKMIVWRMVAIETWTIVDRASCWWLWSSTEIPPPVLDGIRLRMTERHRATRIQMQENRPGPNSTCRWSRLGCFHLLRYQTGEVRSTGQTAVLMFLL